MSTKVIYTAIFGGRDVLKDPLCVPEGYDFVCFTDAPFKSKVWEVRVVQPTSHEPVRSAKLYKVLPHRFFPEYEYSVWIDGNISILRSPDPLIEKYLKNVNLAAFDHRNNEDSRDCIYDEAEDLFRKMDVGRFKHIDRDAVVHQIQKYRSEGYPPHNGLITSMILLRHHNARDVVDAMELWWEEIERYSPRDQLSFNYIAWKTGLSFSYLPGDSRNNLFFRFGSHKQTVSFRVRKFLSRLLSS